MSINYLKTPIQEINDPLFEELGIRLLIKREDLNHPEISGNKWWKLKYNIEEALHVNSHTLLTFGGAYSNHIFATAAAAHEAGFKSIGIIRGEETLPLNATLSFAKRKGMRLHYVSREDYRHKSEEIFIENLKSHFGEFYMIPEGGTNELAVKGCEEFSKKVLCEIDCDCVCLPVGTGGTIAGIIKGLKGKKEVIGFSALKGGTFLEEEVKNFLKSHASHLKNWKINLDYHFGGYSKRTQELENFISRQWKDHELPLDEVYTSKMIFGIYDLIVKGDFSRGTTILALHTGGLQGRINSKSVAKKFPS